MHRHQRFQVHPRELCEGTAHVGQSEFCFSFSLDPIPSNAWNVWPPCSKSAHSQISAVLSDLCRWYAFFLPGTEGRQLLSQSKRWSAGCQICQTCSATPAMYMYIAVLFRIIMCLVTQWQQIVPAFICLSNLFHCFSNTLLFTCSTASSGRHTLVYPFTIELTMYKRMHEFILDGEVAYDN